MSQQTGTITSFDQGTGCGYLSCNETGEVPVLFSSLEIEGHRSLTVGEPVSYELVHELRHTHAEHIKRTIGDLEAYQNQGGLYS